MKGEQAVDGVFEVGKRSLQVEKGKLLDVGFDEIELLISLLLCCQWPCAWCAVGGGLGLLFTRGIGWRLRQVDWFGRGRHPARAALSCVLRCTQFQCVAVKTMQQRFVFVTT